MLGEVLHLWQRGVRDNEKCGCGERFHDCPFWSEVGRVAFGGWHQVNVDAIMALGARLDRFRFIPANLAASRLSARRAELRAYADFFFRVYVAAAAVSGAAVVVDSSKNASTVSALRVHECLALRVVHVVRDSRGVAYSWSKRVLRPEADASSERSYIHIYSPARSAMLWDAHNAAFWALGKLHTPVHRLFYENLVAHPSESILSVADFLGIDRSAAAALIGDDGIHLQRSHQVAGNPMRFRIGHVKLRRDDAWRIEMSRGARRIVTAMTWPLMKHYGYLSRRGGLG